MLIVGEKWNDMLGLWRKLIASLLVAQLLTGSCCAHHAGLCDATAQRCPSHETAMSTHQDSDCLAAAPQQPHNRHQDCQVGPCSTVLINRVISLPIQLSHVQAVPLLCDLLAQIGNPSEQCSLQSDGRLLPIRLHLANQVLLI